MELNAIQELGINRTFNKNAFIRYSNNLMTVRPENTVNFNMNTQKQNVKMGIENLQEFSLFPKEVVNGRTIITA